MPVRRFAVGASVALSVAASAVSPAFGSAVRLKAVNFGPNGYVEHSLTVTAGAGEQNSMTVRVNGGVAVVRDRSARVGSKSRRCKQRGLHVVRCTTSRIPAVGADLGDRDDVLVVSVRRGFATPEVAGGPGHDRIEMRNRQGRVEGGAGNDVILTDAGHSLLLGGPGNDRIHGGEGHDSITGESGDDTLRGGQGNDNLTGGAGAGQHDGRPPGRDALHGGSGPDSFHDGDRPGHVGPDRIVGGTGSDFVSSYVGRQRPVSVDLNRPGGQGQRGEGDSLSGVEAVYGGDRDDRLIGDGDGNELQGRLGDDFVRGGGGDDVIEAMEGDEISGDLGDDEVLTASWSRATVRCDDGDDLVVSDPGRTPVLRLHEDPAAGPLLAPDCELIQGRHPDSQKPYFTVDPTPGPMTDSGDLTFRLPEFCCGHNFRLARAAEPFEELDATKADKPEVTVTAPPDVVASAATAPTTLRIVTFDTHAEARDADVLVWRFTTQR